MKPHQLCALAWAAGGLVIAANLPADAQTPKAPPAAATAVHHGPDTPHRNPTLSVDVTPTP